MTDPHRRTWKDLSLRTKGMVLVATPVVLLLTAVVITHSIVGSAARRSDERLNESTRRERLLVELMANLSHAQSEALNLALGPESRSTTEYYDARLEVRHILDELEALEHGDDGSLEAARGSVEGVLVDLQHLRNEALDGELSREEAALVLAIETRMDDLRDQVGEWQREEAAESAAQWDRQARYEDQAQLLVTGIGVVVALGGIFVANVLFFRSISRRVTAAGANAKRLAQGHELVLDGRAADEIGVLEADLVEGARLLEERDEELHTAGFRLRKITETIDGVFFMARPDLSQILYISHAYEKIWGRSVSALYENADEWMGAVLDEDLPGVAEAIGDRITEPVDMEYRIVRPDRAVRWIRARGFPVFDQAGEITHIVGLAEDVTDRKTMVEELRDATSRAEAADRAKSEFLSRMSHELRTPLNAILGFAQLLSLDDLNGGQRESVEQIERGGRRLMSLIEETVNIARIESGQTTLSIEPVLVEEVLEGARDLCGPLAAERELTLEVRISEEMSGASVMADRQRLEQVLLNLVSNAIKYNREGGSVTLSCVRSGDEVSLHVTDTGPGIAPDDIDKIYEPFERLGAEYSDVEGAGLGLSLGRRMTEAMGGRLSVTSGLGGGSTFSVTLTAASTALEGHDGHPDVSRGLGSGPKT